MSSPTPTQTPNQIETKRIKVEVSDGKVKSIVIDNKLLIEFGPHTIEVENAVTKSTYILTMDPYAEDPWFSNYHVLMEQISKHDEDTVIKSVINTLRNYFDPAWGL